MYLVIMSYRISDELTLVNMESKNDLIFSAIYLVVISTSSNVFYHFSILILPSVALCLILYIYPLRSYFSFSISFIIFFMDSFSFNKSSHCLSIALTLASHSYLSLFISYSLFSVSFNVTYRSYLYFSKHSNFNSFSVKSWCIFLYSRSVLSWSPLIFLTLSVSIVISLSFYLN